MIGGYPIDPMTTGIPRGFDAELSISHVVQIPNRDEDLTYLGLGSRG